MSNLPRRILRQWGTHNRINNFCILHTNTYTPSIQPSVYSKQRFVHLAPKEYNGLQSAAYHFKRQKHMPYFLEYLMWVVFGSEALHLIWLKMEYKEYQEKVQHKIRLLEETIRRLERGESIDDNLRDEIRVFLAGNKHSEDVDEDVSDDYLDKLIASSEENERKTSTPEAAVTKTPLIDSKWVEVDEKTEGKEKKPFFL